MSHTIRRRGGTIRIYQQQEADDLGIDYLPFREITGPTPEKGCWGLTDDGYVSEILSCKQYTDKRGSSKTFVRLSFGAVWLPRRKPFCFEPYLQAGTFGGTVPRRWIDREIKTVRVRRTVQAYCAMILSPSGLDWGRLGRIYRSDQACPERTVRKLFREEKIQQMAIAHLREVFTGEHFTIEEICDHYRDLLTMAKEARDLELLRSTLDRLREWVS